MKPLALICTRTNGFTLIELMVTIAVLALLLMLTAPNISEWIHNSQIRTAAESIVSGLQTARNEAVRQNRNVEFRLTNPTTTGGTGWRIKLPGTADTDNIQEAANSEGARSAVVSVTPNGSTTVTFTGLGRTPDTNKNADASDLITRLEIDSSSLAADKSREMCIMITTGGQIRMCDPNITDATDPRSCESTPCDKTP